MKINEDLVAAKEYLEMAKDRIAPKNGVFPERRLAEYYHKIQHLVMEMDLAIVRAE
jgi:hypothetical protein